VIQDVEAGQGHELELVSAGAPSPERQRAMLAALSDFLSRNDGTS
jgi:hypothetical protein